MNMIETLKISIGILAAPNRTVHDETFDKGTFPAWFMCQLPLIAVLTWTGLMDPADGYGFDVRSCLFYLGGAGIICLFSMLLSVAKSFLILWAGGIRLPLFHATRRLLPLLCLLVLIEAVVTLILFLLRNSLSHVAYTVAEQIHLFGQELLFGAGTVYIMYQREQVSLRRSIAAGMGYFFCASCWLLLTIILG
jgi:hypothetical protein